MGVQFEFYQAVRVQMKLFVGGENEPKRQYEIIIKWPIQVPKWFSILSTLFYNSTHETF